MRRREHAQRELPDGGQSLAHDGGGTHQDTVGLPQLRGHGVDVAGDHVIGFHRDVARVPDAGGDALCQLGGVAVGADVGHHHQLARALGRQRAPLAVQVEDLVEVAVQHGAVAGADHPNIHACDLFQRVGHIGVGEGADDVVEVILRSPEIALLIRHGGAEDAGMAVMAAEGVAGEEYAVLLHIGVHGVGPVEVGQHHEAQRLAAQRQGVPVFYGHGVEVPVDDLLQEPDGGAGAHDHQAGIELDELFDGAGMVRLRVVHHQVVDGLRTAQLRQALFIFVPEFQLACLKQRGFLAAAQGIRIIGGAELRHHHDIEDPQLRVQNAVPIQAVSQLEGFHKRSS